MAARAPQHQNTDDSGRCHSPGRWIAGVAFQRLALPATLPAMHKTSVYLTEDERKRLAWLAEIEGTSQAAIIREAIAAYARRPPTGRYLALIGSGVGKTVGPPPPLSDDPQAYQDYIEELMRDFGADSFGDSARDAHA